MAKGVYMSKTLAIATVVLTVSALSGIIVMVALYQMQIEKWPPVRPPTPVPTTPIPTGLPSTLRLPDNLIPESYKVFLQPYLYVELTNGTEQIQLFKGNSTVRIKCVKDTRTIFLHALSLFINNVIVTHSDTREKVEVRSYKLHTNDTQFLEIQLKDVLKGNGTYYDLFTEFEGELGELTGLYMSQYTEKNNGEDEKRFLVASQMQPTDARKVFPCFDEPAMKAVFNITIIHRRDTKALSNAKKDTSNYVEIDGESWIATTFYPTPVMSTYLMAFTVNTFKSKDAKHDNKDVKIWARPEAVDSGHADYTWKITGKLLSFYEEQFQLKYPLNKLDLMALPDFMAGGMENWGLTMYREAALLYEEGVSSTFNKEWIATVVAHELAHQWFGNLVTMKWWNYLWLNEGFATYISYLGVDAIQPEWNIKELFVLKEIQQAMEFDSLNYSHPLSLSEFEAETPDDILGLFNSVTYSKGAAVLRMLAAHMGENKFLEGLRLYLKTYQYNNTDSENLWECMQKVTHENIRSMMKSWNEQPGYPVVSINISTGEIAQEQFLLNRAEDTGLEWQIPIHFNNSNKLMKDLLKEKGPVRKPDFEIKGDSWLLANLNYTGYFRVNYDEENWSRLLHQLKNNHHAIPVINRGQLIDDAFNLARAKYINVTLALNTTKYLINETEYIPWDYALTNLRYFILMFDRSEVYGPLQKYLREQVAPLYEHFKNYTDNATVPETLSEQYNQINAIDVACTNGVPECREMARSLFNEWENEDIGQNRIPPNLKAIIYCNAIAEGDEDDWDFMWKQYENAIIAAEKDKLRHALACTKKVWLLNRYLEYSLDPSKIRKMDAASTIISIAKNVAGQALAWDFIRAHWTYISKEYGYVASLGNMIDKVTERFSTTFELQQLLQFQSEHQEDVFGPAGPDLEHAIERTEANIKWVNENKHTVLNWFREE